jgi:hypothetical protein
VEARLTKRHTHGDDKTRRPAPRRGATTQAAWRATSCGLMRGRRAIATANPRVGREMGRCNTICAVAGVGAFSCYSNQRRESPHLLAGAAIERGARGRSYGAFQAIQATSSLGERIFEADLRDVSYLSRCLDDVLMCGQRRAVVLTGAHGYNLLMTKILSSKRTRIMTGQIVRDDSEIEVRTRRDRGTAGHLPISHNYAATATGPAGARRGAGGRPGLASPSACAHQRGDQ